MTRVRTVALQPSGLQRQCDLEDGNGWRFLRPVLVGDDTTAKDRAAIVALCESTEWHAEMRADAVLFAKRGKDPIAWDPFGDGSERLLSVTCRRCGTSVSVTVDTDDAQVCYPKTNTGVK